MSANTLIICVSGQCGSGMTEFCTALQEILSSRGIGTLMLSTLDLAFAVYEKAFGVDMRRRSQTEDRFKDCLDQTEHDKSWHNAVRDVDEALRLGRDMNLIAKSLLHRMNQARGSYSVCIIDNVVAINDIEAMKKKGALFVRMPDSYARHRQKFEKVHQRGGIHDGFTGEEYKDLWYVHFKERAPSEDMAQNIVSRIESDYPAIFE